MRWTKTHLIEEAKKRLHLPKDVISYRHRFLQTQIVNVDQGLSQLIQSIPAQTLFVPYLVSGLMSKELGQAEISFFANSEEKALVEILPRINNVWSDS